MAQNLIEKIAQRFAVGLPEGSVVRSGDFLTVRPQHVMTHDNTAAVMKKFQSIGATEMADPKQPVFTLDHNVQDRSEGNLEKYASIQAFAESKGVDFHPAGRGIGHQVMSEEGYAWPGTLVVASDSHSNLYGGLGALGTPVVRTDAAAIWATGTTWFQVPPVALVRLGGALRPGVSGKDVILALCGYFGQDEVLNHAVEFSGEAVAALDMDSRLTIANMTTEWGALAGVFPVDGVTLDWLKARAAALPEASPSTARFHQDRIAELEARPPAADAGASYAKVLDFDLSSVTPHVCGPNSVKTLHSVRDLASKKIPVQKAYLLSCVNGRVQDLAEAASVVAGSKIHPQVKLYVAAASSVVQAESEARGDWAKLLAAGAIALPPGCGPCIGLGEGLLEDGEVGISATNRNFKGRMGSREAEAYLASPAVVAASALAGYITGPEAYEAVELNGAVEDQPAASGEAKEIPILPGFPESMEGELLFCDADNLNTDGIYPGAYTYREDLSREQMAAVAMENYDAEFQNLAAQGDILVSGYNFGTGSSREQAATALHYRGLQLIVAGSFSATYKRNAFNNGILLVDCPGLTEFLRANGPAAAPTVRPGWKAGVDFRTGKLKLQSLDDPSRQEEFDFAPLGPTAQELVLAGGLENLVQQKLQPQSG
ncbi:MAG: homoaconitase [Planctomycetota bacterium]|nr:MAG: homoaconitase [Planctomycetota bacterium]